MEALIGAIYYDKGFKFTEKFILNNWKKYLDLSEQTFIDSKTKLQEYSLNIIKNYQFINLFLLLDLNMTLNSKLLLLQNTNFYEGTGESKKGRTKRCQESIKYIGYIMQWDDKGYLIYKNKYSENSAIIEFYTSGHGKVTGILYGATSKKLKIISNWKQISYNI